MQLYGSERRGKEFLMRAILGHLARQTAEEFAEQEMAIIKARNEPLRPCEHGFPGGLLCPDCTESV